MNNEHPYVSGKPLRINRALLEESTQRALATHQDVKIPDGLIVIDRDLLQDIRDSLEEAGNSKDFKHCLALCDKLDSLYPYLK